MCGHQEHVQHVGLVNYDVGYMGCLCSAFGVPFWPPDFSRIDCSVQKAIDRIKAIGIARRGRASCEHTGKKREVTALELKQFTNDLANTCGPLCLYCVKEGNPDLLSACTNAEHA